MLKKFFKSKLHISTDYLIFFAIIFLTVFISSITSVVLVYNSNLELHQKSSQEKSNRIDNAINEIIDEYSWKIRSLADKVSKTGDNIDKIAEIFSSYNQFQSQSNKITWKNLHWVDKNQNVLIKDRIGIINNPYKLPHFYEIFRTDKKKWQLFLSEQSLSENNINPDLIFNTFGVTDFNKNYIGTIASTIDIKLIYNILQKKLAQKDITNFVILNNKTKKVILDSNKKNPIIEDFFIYKVGNINYHDNNTGFIEEEIIDSNGIKYNHYKSLRNYPFIIITGYDYHQYKITLFNKIITTLIPHFAIGLLLLLTLFIFYKRVVKPIKILSKAVKQMSNGNYDSSIFPRQIPSPEIFDLTKGILKIKRQKSQLKIQNKTLVDSQDQLKTAIDTIKRSDITQMGLVRQIRQEINKNSEYAIHLFNLIEDNVAKGGNNQETLFLIRSLTKELSNITKFATTELNKEEANIRQIISRAIISQERVLEFRKIPIYSTFNPDVPDKVFVDQIRLTQLISSIINKMSKILGIGNQIDVVVEHKVKSKKKYISIQIKDNSIGIGIKDYMQDLKNLGGKEENATNGIDLPVDVIEELISLHKGFISYESTINVGSKITILIPYTKSRQKQSTPKTKTTTKKIDNIIYLPIKQNPNDKK